MTASKSRRLPARRLLGLLTLGLLVGALGLALFVRRWVPTTPPSPPDYARADAWLCRPGRVDSCERPLRALIVERDGARRRETFAPNPAAPVDCFYVYPTVSRVRAAYAPIAATPTETQIARQQLARFTPVCRPFAPLYRQVTLAGLPALFRGDKGVDLEVPYADIFAAWRYYLAHDNGGRRIVLIGHSQGARVLAKLIAAEIDGKPIQSRIVAAILPGATIDVPAGEDVGGSFHSMPLCHAQDESGCVIAYSTFPAARPMLASAYFGATGTAGMRNACVNPAQLVGAKALDAAIPLPPDLKIRFDADIVEIENSVTASCRWDGHFSVLAIGFDGNADLGENTRDLIARLGQYHPRTGFHVLDLQLASGTLTELIHRLDCIALDVAADGNGRKTERTACRP